MKISDVEKITGLTAKSIRYYEDKGLVRVLRKENAYREYDEDSVERLKKIKFFREIGISVSELKLYFNHVISAEEMINKRRREIEAENVTSKKQYQDCMELLNTIAGSEEQHERTDAYPIIMNHEKVAIGIDIGTTTISAAVVGLERKRVIETYTMLGESDRSAAEPGFHEQDVDKIMDKVMRIAEFLTSSYPCTVSIGLTGQMHGVVCVDSNGRAVSSLYTWQDERADRRMNGKATYCEHLEALTGKRMNSGFGFATLYYNRKQGLLPPDAVTFCTIMDYAGMVLTGRKRPLMHVSNAASLGFFDISRGEFDQESIRKAELDCFELPELAKENQITGYYKMAAVSAAIGDNQASVYGSIRKEEGTVLINFGTGSQLSRVCKEIPKAEEACEVRPYVDGKYLLNYSALCGGRAYSILERFFRSYAKELNPEAGIQYDVLNVLAQRAYDNAYQKTGDKEHPKSGTLTVSTLFCGTRKDPLLRGGIYGIDEENFTPENLALGVIRGMVDELAENRSIMENDVITGVVASGNAVQKNSVLQQVIADAFQAEVQIPAESEEAAYGAALFGAVNAGAITRTQGKEMIRYKNEKEEERGYESEQGDYIIGLSLWLTMSVRMRTGLTGRTVWMVQFTQREERSIPSLR